jgi:hypothetical protein
MSVIDPMLWTDFCGFCKERDFSLAFALARALGAQFDYEEQKAYCSNIPRTIPFQKLFYHSLRIPFFQEFCLQ